MKKTTTPYKPQLPIVTDIRPVRTDIPIYLCGAPVDMRYGLPGLAKKIEDEQRDPKERAMYVFVSRNHRRIKLFYWDGNGYAMWYKAVASSVFRVEIVNGYRKITGVRLRELISAKK